MPTYAPRPRFLREYERLTPAEQKAFRHAVGRFIADLRAGGTRFHPSLRVHRIDSQRGVWSLSFGPDLRATFSYGPAQRENDPHVIWRRIGKHNIYL